MEEKYYHFRDEEKRPVITVCLLKMGDQIARGIAICSDLDNPCKKYGRDRALERAIEAIVAEKNSRYMRRKEVLKKWRHYSVDFNTISKVTYAPILTEFERKLLRKPVKKKYELQNLPGFLIEKGQFLYEVDGTLCGITKQASEPVGICVDSEYVYNMPHNLLNEIRELKQRIHQLEYETTCFTG